MNAPFSAPLQTDEYDRQLERTAEWRDRFVQQFAELETAIAECLLLLARNKKLGTKVRLGRGFGPAFDELVRLTAADGAFGKEGKALRSSLAALARDLEWRAHLTDGAVDVWRGRKAQWLMTFRRREHGDSGTVRWHAIPFDEGERMVSDLSDEIAKFNRRVAALEINLRRPS